MEINKQSLFIFLFIFIVIIGATVFMLMKQPAASNSQLANPASVFCGEHRGKLEIKTDSTGGQYGICIFSDGSSCEEWAYFRGECNQSTAAKITSVDVKSQALN
jgi:putative hemolysin